MELPPPHADAGRAADVELHVAVRRHAGVFIIGVVGFPDQIGGIHTVHRLGRWQEVGAYQIQAPRPEADTPTNPVAEPTAPASDTFMAQEIFYPDLNTFCRTYFISNRPVSSEEGALLTPRWKEQEAALFEQLMLFDKISFKVSGENILVPVLIRMFGLKGFEELIEQRSLGFNLWPSDVTHLLSDVPGVDPLQFMTHNAKPYVDPEASIMHGFRWMKEKLPLDVRRRLTRKLLSFYQVVPADLTEQAVCNVHSAYRSGALKLLGMDTAKDIGNLPVDAKAELAKCASEVMEYSYLLGARMTSFSNPHYYALFHNSASKIQAAEPIQKNFNSIASIEGFPDLKGPRSELGIPLSKLPKLRQKRNAVQFRDWLSTTTYSAADASITREYISAIADAKGFFDTKRGKVTKSVAMTAIGTGIGAMIGGREGGAAGAIIAKFLEPASDFALDLLDEFLISRLTKGWTPRMFFDDLRKVGAPQEK